MLPVFTFQTALCALLILEGKKIYLILNNSPVAACFYAKLGWKIWFGVEVFLEVYAAGFISSRTRTIFELGWNKIMFPKCFSLLYLLL